MLHEKRVTATFPRGRKWNKRHEYDVQGYDFSDVRTTATDQPNQCEKSLGSILSWSIVYFLAQVFNLHVLIPYLANPIQLQFNSGLLGLFANWLLWRALARCLLYQYKFWLKIKSNDKSAFKCLYISLHILQETRLFFVTCWTFQFHCE